MATLFLEIFFKNIIIFPLSVKICPIEKGQIRDENDNCVCPPGKAKDENDVCVICRKEIGMVINKEGECVCALEKGMIIDEHGNCRCPEEHGYVLDIYGYCKPGICLIIFSLSLFLIQLHYSFHLICFSFSRYAFEFF